QVSFPLKRCLRALSNMAFEHERATYQAAPGGDDPASLVLYLPLTTLPAQLPRAFDHVADRVQATAGKAPAVCVARDRAADRYVAVGDELTSFTFRADAQIFEPAQREPREPVVQLREVEVLRPEPGALRRVLRAVLRRHVREVFPLVPVGTRPRRELSTEHLH